jgi:serine-threonine kinase receptor-associated protein
VIVYTFSHKHIVKTCSFSKDSTKLITGGSEKIIRIFDLQRLDTSTTTTSNTNTNTNDNATAMTVPMSELTGAPSQIKTARYICNDELILSSCSDNADLRVWDARTNIICTTLKTENAVTSIEISEDGKYVTTADGKNVTLWEVSSFRAIKTWKMKYNMESASVSMKEGKFVCGGEDMWVHLYDCETGEEIGEPGKGHHGPIHCVRFHPDGKSYASGSEDGTIRIWRL